MYATMNASGQKYLAMDTATIPIKKLTVGVNARAMKLKDIGIVVISVCFYQNPAMELAK